MSERVVRTPAERRLGYLRVLEARSSSTPGGRLRVLASDEIRPVRLWTARSRQTPPDALDLLARDEDETVRWNVLLNPRTPAGALQGLADREAANASEGWFIDRELIFHHPNTSRALRQALAAAGACRNEACRTEPSVICPEVAPYRRRWLE